MNSTIKHYVSILMLIIAFALSGCGNTKGADAAVHNTEETSVSESVSVSEDMTVNENSEDISADSNTDEEDDAEKTLLELASGEWKTCWHYTTRPDSVDEFGDEDFSIRIFEDGEFWRGYRGLYYENDSGLLEYDPTGTFLICPPGWGSVGDIFHIHYIPENDTLHVALYPQDPYNCEEYYMVRIGAVEPELVEYDDPRHEMFCDVEGFWYLNGDETYDVYYIDENGKMNNYSWEWVGDEQKYATQNHDNWYLYADEEGESGKAFYAYRMYYGSTNDNRVEMKVVLDGDILQVDIEEYLINKETGEKTYLPRGSESGCYKRNPQLDVRVEGQEGFHREVTKCEHYEYDRQVYEERIADQFVERSDKIVNPRHAELLELVAGKWVNRWNNDPDQSAIFIQIYENGSIWQGSGVIEDEHYFLEYDEEKDCLTFNEYASPWVFTYEIYYIPENDTIYVEYVRDKLGRVWDQMYFVREDEYDTEFLEFETPTQKLFEEIKGNWYSKEDPGTGFNIAKEGSMWGFKQNEDGTYYYTSGYPMEYNYWALEQNKEDTEGKSFYGKNSVLIESPDYAYVELVGENLIVEIYTYVEKNGKKVLGKSQKEIYVRNKAADAMWSEMPEEPLLYETVDFCNLENDPILEYRFGNFYFR